MQFVVIAHNSPQDENQNTAEIHELHSALANQMRQNGQLVYSILMTDHQEQPTGKVMVCNFPSKDHLFGWLKQEPYVQEGIWKKIIVRGAQPAV